MKNLSIKNTCIAYSQQSQGPKRAHVQSAMGAKQLSFKGLKENMKFGQRMLDRFNKEFPELKSSTKILAEKGADVLFEPEYTDTFAKIDIIRKATTNRYLKMPSHQWFINTQKAFMSAFKVGNCGESATVLQDMCFQEGVPARLSRFLALIKDGDSKSQNRWVHDHSNVTLGHAPNYDLKNPETWGDEAVSVDPWFNKVAPSGEMIKFYEDAFKINPETEYLKFQSVNRERCQPFRDYILGLDTLDVKAKKEFVMPKNERDFGYMLLAKLLKPKE